MANKKSMRHASALKAHRKSLANKAQNYQTRNRLRTLTNNVLKAILEKNQSSASDQFLKAQSAWSKAAHRGVYHKNAASRIISRLSQRISAMAKS